MGRYRVFQIVFFLSSVLLHGVEENVMVLGNPPTNEWETYFTGPLLSPSGTVLPVGHYDIEPYLFFTVTNGIYDEHWKAHKIPNFYSLTPNLYFDVGLTQKMDFAAFLPVTYNWTEGVSDFGVKDFTFFVNYQLWEEDTNKWFPGVKIGANLVVPIGKYQNFDPDKKLTDFRGYGAWGPSLEVVFYKLFHIKEQRFLSLTFNFVYSVYSDVRVRGLNAYGGGVNTKGVISPGDSITAGFAFEYSFTRYWAIAMDAIYLHNNKDTFAGRFGRVSAADSITIGLPSMEQFTLSPAIEYNFSKNLGLIAGIWFTVVGRNASRFQSGVVALNYFY